MAYEFLKKLFGTPKDGEQPKAMTYEELEAAINADSGIKLANLAEGGYVSKNKFDDKEMELSGVQKQLEAANTQIQSFKDQDVEGIKKKVTEWETKYNTDTQALKDKLSAQAREHAEEMFLSGYQFSSKAARSGVLSELRSKQFQIDESGTILGGKEFMKSLMEDDDYKGAFVVEQPKEPETPPAPAPRFASGTGTPAGGPERGSENPFNFGFNMLRQPPKNN